MASPGSSSSDSESSISATSFHNILKQAHVPGHYKEQRKTNHEALAGDIMDVSADSDNNALDDNITSVCGDIVSKSNPADPEMSSYEIIEHESEDETSISMEMAAPGHAGNNDTDVKMVHSTQNNTIASDGGSKYDDLNDISTASGHENSKETGYEDHTNKRYISKDASVSCLDEQHNTSTSSLESFIILSHENWNEDEGKYTNNVSESIASDGNANQETTDENHKMSGSTRRVTDEMRNTDTLNSNGATYDEGDDNDTSIIKETVVTIDNAEQNPNTDSNNIDAIEQFVLEDTSGNKATGNEENETNIRNPAESIAARNTPSGLSLQSYEFMMPPSKIEETTEQTAIQQTDTIEVSDNNSLSNMHDSQSMLQTFIVKPERESHENWNEDEGKYTNNVSEGIASDGNANQETTDENHKISGSTRRVTDEMRNTDTLNSNDASYDEGDDNDTSIIKETVVTIDNAEQNPNTDSNNIDAIEQFVLKDTSDNKATANEENETNIRNPAESIAVRNTPNGLSLQSYEVMMPPSKIGETTEQTAIQQTDTIEVSDNNSLSNMHDSQSLLQTFIVKPEPMIVQKDTETVSVDSPVSDTHAAVCLLSKNDDLQSDKPGNEIDDFTAVGEKPETDETDNEIWGAIDAIDENSVYTHVNADIKEKSDDHKRAVTSGDHLKIDNLNDKATGFRADNTSKPHRHPGLEVHVAADDQKQRLTLSDSFVYEHKDAGYHFTRTKRNTYTPSSSHEAPLTHPERLDDRNMDDDESFVNVPLHLDADDRVEVNPQVKPKLVFKRHENTGAVSGYAKENVGRSGRDMNTEFKRMIRSWNEVNVGNLMYLKYYGFWHAILVTSVFPGRNVLQGIHYAWPGSFPESMLSKLLASRTVQEDEFKVNIANGELWEVFIPESKRVGPEEAIKRARRKLGEHKFNLLSRRSNHFVRECIMKR